MKVVLLAACLLAPASLRAEEAYRSLQGMGAAAKIDKGPDAGEIPAGAAPMEEKKSADSPVGRFDGGRARVEAGKAARDAARSERERRAEAATAAASASQGYSAYWARVYSRLNGQVRASAPESFSVPSSTGPAAAVLVLATR